MAQKPKSKAVIEAIVNAKAWKDPKFKKKLLERPNEALKELGIDLRSMKVRIIEDDSQTVTFVLHHAPENQGSLNDEELRLVAGGSGSGCACGHYSISYWLNESG